MRPVLLELEGFCSYRTKARIDFREADFFVLVGSTGSGKSTVIDAMVFALYGTVPRWDDRNAVAPALAPTVSRGVVRLIFDAGGDRYVAARDIRRVGRGKPSVKEARIERFASADATGEPGDETDVIATGRSVNAAVEQILGLTFEQFTQSVALPQGEFARFLHATDGQRQDILKNLLGYNIYESIQSAAYSRASDAESRMTTLAQQLENYADATDEQVRDLHSNFEDLSEFQKHVVVSVVPALKQAMVESATARDLAHRAASEQGRLSSVERPSGVDELVTEHAARTVAVKSAESRQGEVERRDSEVRGRLRAATPRRILEQALDNWRDFAIIEARLPSLAERYSVDRNAGEAAQEQYSAADGAVRAARDTAAEATKSAEVEAVKLQTVRDQQTKLEALTAPADIKAVADAVNHARNTVNSAISVTESSEAEQRSATEILDAMPDSAILAGAAGNVERILDDITLDAAQTDDRDAALAAMTGARRDADTAEKAVSACEQTLRTAEHVHQAAALRADLHVGDDCPVCGTTIVELASEGAPADLDAARNALMAAKSAAEMTQTESGRLVSAWQQMLAVRSERLQQCDKVRRQLLEHLSILGITNSPAALTEQLLAESSTERCAALQDAAAAVRLQIADVASRRSAAMAEARAADAAVIKSRDALEKARDKLGEAEEGSRKALNAIHVARDSVSALSPPQVDSADISAAWEQLTTWGQEHAAILSGQVASLTASAAEAQSAAQQAGALLEQAEAAVKAAHQVHNEATLATQRAATDLENTKARHSELTAALAAAPSSEAASEQLEVVKGLELQLDDVGAQLEAARSATDEAHQASSMAKAAVDESWQNLRRVRDQLADLNAPEINGVDLSADWQIFFDWTATEAQKWAADIDAQSRLAEEADTRADSAAGELADNLETHSVEVAEGLTPAALVEQAPSQVASAVATAKAQLERAEERKRESEQMQADMAVARETADVARMLSNLMRTNNFPRWLIGSALDTLLRDASGILSDLSAGQFELTRDDKDLLVIDHNDADMSRPVKTLSGGETFQASLALALALSEQVTSLSAAGASRLESIFLDEGFGTLDEMTLDVVASTLESLASTGSRMVGVITHVAALAERIPVRYQVNRDTAGSHIERMAI